MRGPSAAISRQMCIIVALHELGGGDEPGLEGLRRIDRRQPLLERLGSRAASITASINSSLSAKTLKIVPSDTPARWAICLVVTAAPCSTSSGADGVDDRRAPLGRREGSGASALGCGWDGDGRHRRATIRAN